MKSWHDEDLATLPESSVIIAFYVITPIDLPGVLTDGLERYEILDLERWLHTLSDLKFSSCTCPILIINHDHLLKEIAMHLKFDYAILQKQIASKLLSPKEGNKSFWYVGFINDASENNIVKLLKELVSEVLESLP